MVYAPDHGGGAARTAQGKLKEEKKGKFAGSFGFSAAHNRGWSGYGGR
jgi:hypothetical protein